MEYIKLMRPKHYIKNLLIFIPLIFSENLLHYNLLLKTFMGFICFCLIASSIYIINDIKDKEKDKRHSKKCNRPIASGKISVKNAIIEIIILLAISISIIYLEKFSLTSIILLGIYFILNLGYSMGLKNIPLLDIVIVVVGFVIRVLYGASLTSIVVSNWLLLTIFSISFYLAMGKRRNEIIINGNNARKVLKYYNRDFLTNNMNMFLGISIVFYALWSNSSYIIESSNNLMIWTTPLVIILALRYNLVIDGNSDGDPTEVILKDKAIILLSILLFIFIFTIIYIV